MPAAPAITLSTPLEFVKGVGPARAKALATLGLTNLGRLIAYLPSRHEWLEPEAPIKQLSPGTLGSARGTITATRVVLRGRRPRFEAVLIDPTGRLDLVWFNMPHLRTTLHPSMQIRVQGKAARFAQGIQMANPSYKVIHEETPAADDADAEARLRPVYPATEAITSRQIEQVIRKVLPAALPLIEDHLAPDYLRKREMPPLADAYRLMHAPESDADVAAGRCRLAYDELLLLQLGVHLKRNHLRQTLRAPALKWSEAIDRKIRARLPFTLTASQDSVIQDLIRDLTTATPTNRLIQGDVGSGKTVVALYAMLMAVAGGHQAALMAPTELLAEQHFQTLSTLLKGSKVRLELLTGGTPQAERESILARLERGDIDLLIGTHALLTGSVRFSSLALAVIDEQHRFGVGQRATLRAKASTHDLTPHVVVMTATPIPRTLAITLFGDLDISAISGLPPGRRPVTTRVIPPPKRDAVYKFVRERLDQNDQAYIVVPAIDKGGQIDGDAEAPDVRTLLATLESGPLAGKRLAALHGRLKRSTRETIMERFRSGQIDALISTTVVEVGVDVPNATLMVVEQADRFGLAQLHQLRGRVGRGEKPSVCLALAGNTLTPEARQRLEAFAATTDGFALADKDLEIRGPGELFGLKQSGMPPFKVADLTRDQPLLKMARKDAADWIVRSPRLAAPEEALTRRRLLKAHGQWLGLGDVG
ncbi:MAG: ATP-dependent DNA helicase RecG [Phycisphaerales bacterium]